MAKTITKKTAKQRVKAKATVEKRIEEGRAATVDIIASMIERGGLNWVKEWTTELNAPVFDPYNPFTGNHYRGGNVLRLASECIDNGLDDNRWCTAFEAKRMGWTIKNDAHGGIIEKWKRFSYPAENEDGSPMLNDEGEQVYMTYYKPVSFFYVYNFFEIDGAPQLEHTKRQVREHEELDTLIDALKESSRCPIVERYGNRAFYACAPIDRIEVPERDQFTNLNAAIRTYLHEMGHSTGHASALDRNGSRYHGGMRSKGYAYEELIAELTAVFTASYLGCDLDGDSNMANHAAYLESWLKHLRKDPAYLYSAAAEASKASDYIIDRLTSAHPEYIRTTETIDELQEDAAADMPIAA